MQNLINNNLLLTLLGTLLSLALWSQDYDIYRVHVRTGEVEQITMVQGRNEFNPSFSNNGRYVIHDIVPPQVLAVTEVHTGITEFIPGLTSGNDASWSPNGNLIAFDAFLNGRFGLWVIPATGGEPELVRELGVDAEWSQNSQQLVFTDVLTDELRTIDLASGTETLVTELGFNGSWSNNGKYIAYTDGGNLFTIRVNQAGEPVASPTQLTFDGRGVFNQQPSWSNNSKTIVFHSNRMTGDFDIWTIPARGGTPTQLAGRAQSGDFDPVFSKNGQWVAYASLTTPDGSLADQVEAVPAPISPVADVLTAFPNPFRETVFFRYQLPEASEVDLRIFDAKGTLVATLVDAAQDAGIQQIRWDGKTTDGLILPSGIYTYHLRTVSGQQSGRIIRAQPY